MRLPSFLLVALLATSAFGAPVDEPVVPARQVVEDVKPQVPVDVKAVPEVVAVPDVAVVPEAPAVVAVVEQREEPETPVVPEVVTVIPGSEEVTTVPSQGIIQPSNVLLRGSLTTIVTQLNYYISCTRSSSSR